MKRAVPIEVSARHIHLTKDDFVKLFNKGELTKLKNISQPGQFAAEETVVLLGPKGRLENVRILGPFRDYTQIELSKTDCYNLGITAPIRLSGNIQDSAAITVQGPNNKIKLSEGCIITRRHLHISTEQANDWGFKAGQIIKIKIADGPAGEIRDTIFGDVVVRVNDNFSLACHIDVDDGNAVGINKQTEGYIIDEK